MIATLPEQSLALLAFFVYATLHARVVACVWKPGLFWVKLLHIYVTGLCHQTVCYNLVAVYWPNSGDVLRGLGRSAHAWRKVMTAIPPDIGLYVQADCYRQYRDQNQLQHNACIGYWTTLAFCGYSLNDTKYKHRILIGSHDLSNNVIASEW